MNTHPTDPDTTDLDPDTTGPGGAGPGGTDAAAVREAGWLALSAAMTDEVAVIADREDLLVRVAPGAGHGSPACFVHATATIEVDGTYLGEVDPATATPSSVGDRWRYASVWGLLTHESAHARHSPEWQRPPGTPPGVVAAVALLEESRVEAAQIRRRPDDRHWLRAAVRSLILPDPPTEDPARAPHPTRWEAGRTAALLLGRGDAGVLTPAETAPVARAVEAVLGVGTLAELRALWRTAQRLADGDTDAMLALGTRWCDTLGVSPETTPPATTACGGGPASAGPATPPSVPPPVAVASVLAGAVTDTLDAVTAAVAAEPVPTDPAATAAAGRAAEDTARHSAARAARAVFTRGGSRSIRGRGFGSTATAGTRAATDAERRAARRLARALSTAGVGDRALSKTSSVTPPGRLRMRGALAADAQRAAGAIPTAEPFTRTTRAMVAVPPLRLGVACDVSGSMREFAGPVASAAWILAHAAHHTRVPATTATVIFGNRVRPVTRPGVAPVQVTEFDACDSTEDPVTAIDALDGALQLSRPTTARLLVIISDGCFETRRRHEAQARITRLRATGCAVLWLAPDSAWTTPLAGVTAHPLADPATTAQAIGHAAATALRATH